MIIELPVDLTVAVFEVLVPTHDLVVGDRILLRRSPQGTLYELYRRLRGEDVEDHMVPGKVELTATEPHDVYAEVARLFARVPASRQALRRLK